MHFIVYEDGGELPLAGDDYGKLLASTWLVFLIVHP